MTELLTLAALAALAWATLAYRARRALPAPLRGATLHLNEKPLSITEPVSLRGRPDQVWRTRDNTLVITDTKTRKSARVFPADRLQLSAYALLLEETQDLPLHHVAFIRVPATLGSVFRPIDLLPREAVLRAVDRHHALLSAQTPPRTNASEALCRHCGHREICPRWA